MKILFFVCLVPDPPHVGISSSGSAIAGEMYAITCNVSLNQNLRQTPVMEWVGPSGLVLNDNSLENVSLSTSSPSTTLTLLFTPLHTSHAGSYVCRAVTIDTDAAISITNNNTSIILVEGKFW